MDNQRLLSEDQLAEIRAGVREGIRGPVLTRWLEQLLGDHDERVRLDEERLRTSFDRVRERYGRRAVPEEDAD